MIYLDYNATTPIDPQVAQAMLPYIQEHFGNPSSSHALGQTTKLAVEKAREQVATLLGCSSDEILFTSGGSESNNMAIKGIAYTLRFKGDHIITSSIEVLIRSFSITSKWIPTTKEFPHTHCVEFSKF